MVCCLTLERPGWWSRAARWLEAAREELVWRLEPEPAVVIPMSADRAREELNRRAEELLDRHGNAILRYAYSYLHNMSDAEEVLQDTMIQFLKAAPQFDGPSHEKAWLLRVMTNRCRDLLRWRARHPQVDLDELRHLAAPDENSNILAALMRLPPKLRLVMTLHYIEGYSVSEIAPMIGRTPSAVKMRLQKGRIELETIYRKEFMP